MRRLRDGLRIEDERGGVRTAPHCGSLRNAPCTNKTMPYRCRETCCRKRLSVRIVTTMQRSHFGYRTGAFSSLLVMTLPKETRRLLNYG